MTVTLVCDPSEAMELCASQRLYLKPVAKLTISVVFPEHIGPPRALSKWEVMDKLKNMICPEQFTSVKVSKSTKGFIRFEGEAETKRLVCVLKEKLHGKMIKLNGFKDGLQVLATEEPSDFLAPQASEPIPNDRELLEEDFAKQSEDVPDCIHLEGLPCKWFALKGSESEMPSEDVLRAVFEGFGKIKNVDIPMLDPYREETVGGNTNSFTFRGLRTFEAYVQYQEVTAFAKAMETLKGMKLMLKGDDGKALACNIKVTSDTTNHFSESAINHRHLERLTLQGLERERKKEESRVKKGAERKRRDDDDEKKVGEGKRKSKIKRREKRQIDRDEKRPRKQQKLTAGEALWPENMPEWEERKYLLAQRRVESIRLLTVLLSQIKDFVLSSRQTGQHVLSLESKREDCFSASQIQNTQKEKADSHCFGYPKLRGERELRFPKRDQLEDSDIEGEEEEEEQCFGIDQPASLRPLGRTVLNEPAVRAVTSRLTDKDIDSGRGRGLLQVTVTQDCKVTQTPDTEDYPGLSLGRFSKAPSAGNCKKPKVYETEEFIHYLLNYYQTPRYARICPVTHDTETEPWWQRVVSRSGDGFRVSLKNHEGRCLTEVSFEPDLPEGSSRGSDNYEWELLEEEQRPVEVMPESHACKREFTETSPGQDSLEETSDRTLHDEPNSPFLGSTTNRARDKKPQGDNADITALLSRKSLSRIYKLKDLLEEISSDSEYFSEECESQSKMEERNGGCRNSCKAWPLSRQRARELLICVQNVARGEEEGTGSQRSFCCDLTKHPRQRLKTASKRPGGKVRREGHKPKCPSSEEEKEACRRKKKKLPGNSLPCDRPHFFRTNHCGESESFEKVPRKCHKVLHHKTKCKTVHNATGVAKTKNAIHLGAFQLQEARPEAGDSLLRREVESDSERWPLFPVEIIQTSPYTESVYGAELDRGC